MSLLLLFCLAWGLAVLTACTQPGKDSQSPGAGNLNMPGTQSGSSLERATVTFTVDGGSNAGPLKALNGVQGAPKPTNSQDPDLTEQYRQAGIHLIRFQQDDGFGDQFDNDAHLMLGDIFPNRKADVEDPAQYDFKDIDEFMQSILNAGATPLFSASYDIGSDSNAWAPNGNQTGHSPRDFARWAVVVAHVLQHLNDRWGTVSQPGHAWDIRYVEFPNEPCGLGGVDCRSAEGRRQLFDVYAALSRAVTAYNTTYGHQVKVLGLALPADPGLKILDEFTAYLKSNNLPLDIYSYHDYAWPDRILENARQVRARLNAAGYQQAPIWNSEWNWPMDSPPQGLKLDTAGQSAYVASHNAQVKTLVQGLWDEATVYRANRPAKRPNHDAGEFFYFYLAGNDAGLPPGTPKPAYYDWPIFDRLAKETPQRLAVQSNAPSPTALAARSVNGDHVAVLLSHWCQGDTRSCPEGVEYSLQITGLAPGIPYTAERYVVDAGTKALSAAEQTQVTTDAGGSLRLAGSMPVWSLAFWALRTKPG